MSQPTHNALRAPYMTVLAVVLVTIMVTFACGEGSRGSGIPTAPPEPPPTETVVESPASLAPSETAVNDAEPPAPISTETAAPEVESRPQQSVESIMYRLIEGQGQAGERPEALSALAEIEASGNRGYLPANVNSMPIA